MVKTWEDEELVILAQYTYTNKSARALWLELDAAGYFRTFKAVLKKIEQLGMQKPRRFKMGHEKVYGYLDIEASNLNANFGLMLTWALKLRDGEIISSVMTKEELYTEDMDKALCQRLIEAMEKYEIDVVVTHYGGPGRFDIPFIIARCEFHGLRWKGHGQLRHIDTHRLAKRVLKLHSYRLDAIEQFFGSEEKTRILPKHWVKALRGDADAVAYILDHNIKDVKVLERIHKRLERYCPGSSIIV